MPGSRVMRFGQTLQIEEPNFRGSGVPRRALPTRSHVVLYFNTGLPLPPGQVLVWRARIDGESRPRVDRAVLRARTAPRAGLGLMLRCASPPGTSTRSGPGSTG